LSKTAFDRYRPGVVSGGVGDFQDRALGFRSRYGVDQRYFRMAGDHGKQRLYLETLRYQIRVLSRTPDAEWAAGIEPSIDDGGRSTVNLVRLWRRGNVDAVAAGVDAGAIYSPNIYRALLVERNKNWLPYIQSYLSQSSTTMVVVGAAHLVGKRGLVKMLTNRGYDVLQMPGIAASNTFLTLSYETLAGTTNIVHAAPQPYGLDIAPTVVVEQTWLDLRVRAVGDGAITYHWFKDGNPFLSETNGVLHVENITLDHAGVYTVESQNEFGSSLPARCSIMVQPSLLTLQP
jgi:hypothetical protein